MSLPPITVLAYNKKLRSRFSWTRGWMWWELLRDTLFCAFMLAGSHRAGQQCWAKKREAKGSSSDSMPWPGMLTSAEHTESTNFLLWEGTVTTAQ